MGSSLPRRTPWASSRLSLPSSAVGSGWEGLKWGKKMLYFTGGAAVCLQEEGQMGGQEFQPYPRTASGQTHPCGGLLQLSLRTRTPLQHESAILHQRGNNTPSVPIETKAPKESGNRDQEVNRDLSRKRTTRQPEFSFKLPPSLTYWVRSHGGGEYRNVRFVNLNRP